jgi:hypothetical protein
LSEVLRKLKGRLLTITFTVKGQEVKHQVIFSPAMVVDSVVGAFPAVRDRTIQERFMADAATRMSNNSTASSRQINLYIVRSEGKLEYEKSVNSFSVTDYLRMDKFIDIMEERVTDRMFLKHMKIRSGILAACEHLGFNAEDSSRLAIALSSSTSPRLRAIAFCMPYIRGDNITSDNLAATGIARMTDFVNALGGLKLSRFTKLKDRSVFGLFDGLRGVPLSGIRGSETILQYIDELLCHFRYVPILASQLEEISVFNESSHNALISSVRKLTKGKKKA